MCRQAQAEAPAGDTVLAGHLVHDMTPFADSSPKKFSLQAHASCAGPVVLVSRALGGHVRHSAPSRNDPSTQVQLVSAIEPAGEVERAGQLVQVMLLSKISP